MVISEIIKAAVKESAESPKSAEISPKSQDKFNKIIGDLSSPEDEVAFSSDAKNSGNSNLSLTESYAKFEQILDKESSAKADLNHTQMIMISLETGWPMEIVQHIKTMGQCEIYKNADLHFATIDGRPCLAKNIDMDYVDAKTGNTNRELMAKGRTPVDSKTGEKIELHHMGQDFDAPYVELCENSEHGDGNDEILHNKSIESWRRNPEQKSQYNWQKMSHWMARSEE